MQLHESRPMEEPAPEHGQGQQSKFSQASDTK